MIAKSRLKLALALAMLGLIVLALLATIAGMGRLLAYFNSGADPAGIFKMVPTVPIDLKDRVTWLPDLPTATAGRPLAAYTREQIAGAYLYGWAQWGTSYELKKPYNLKSYFAAPALDMVSAAVTSTVAAGWQLRQSNLHHLLELTFFSDDGQLIAFTDHNAHLVQQLLDADGQMLNVQETTSVYAVVMRLEDGNWRIRDLVRQGNGESLEPVRKGPPPANFVQVADGQLVVDGQPFTVAGVNYYPQASPWTLFWPEYKTIDTVADLDLIKALGLNTVRIFISYADFGADSIDSSALVKLTHFLNQAQVRGLKVIVTLFDHHTDHSVANWAADDRHLAALIPAFAEHAAILAWDIKNEPDRDYGLNTQPLTEAWLRHIAATVRRHDPNHLITIGWSNPEAAVALTDVVDFVSYHYFEDPADYRARLGQLLAAVKPKPVLLQEFVMSTWNSYWPHGHSEAEQALYYADLLGQHRAFPTAGYMVWTLHDFDRVTLPEFNLPWRRATQANMGLLRSDGTQKPAAAIIRPGASLDLPPLPDHYRFTKPFWLLLYALAGGSCLVVGFWWWQWGRWWFGRMRATKSPRPHKVRPRQGALRRICMPTFATLINLAKLPWRVTRWLIRVVPPRISRRALRRLLAPSNLRTQLARPWQWFRHWRAKRRLAQRQATMRRRAARQATLRKALSRSHAKRPPRR